MNYKSIEEFVGIVGEEFLWNIISDYVERDVVQIKAELKKIPYLDRDIDSITTAEIQTSDEFIITDYHSEDGIMTVSFDMPAIINAHSDDKSVYYRITTSCIGTVEIPDENPHNWKALDFKNMSNQDILSYSHLAKNINVSYEYTEADDCNA
jgi:hypothetical protein